MKEAIKKPTGLLKEIFWSYVIIPERQASLIGCVVIFPRSQH